MLQPGDQAPHFELPDQNGRRVGLRDFVGKSAVVLYFYPKDDTPGCTKQACGFRDSWKSFEAKKAVVLGVSNDDVNSHQKFSKKFGLPFSILADTDKKVVEAYGVYKEKNMYGRKYMGIERTTFIIGKDGRIKQVFPKVKLTHHIEEVLEAL
ncbi:MAG: thioredoxin-dependent thiol peroxidase [Acidobacteriota bacterium]